MTEQKALNSRGQLGNLAGIIATLVVVGVLIGAGFLFLGEFSDELDTESSFTVTDETGAFFNSSNAPYTVDRSTHPGFSSFAITSARNTTDSVIISSGNFTTTSNGTVTNASNRVWNSVTLNYTFVGGGESFEGVNQTIVAFDTIPNLLPLIVLIAMVVIILALVFTIPGARQS